MTFILTCDSIFIDMNTKIIRVSEQRWLELDTLKKAWELSTFDAVLGRLVIPHKPLIYQTLSELSERLCSGYVVRSLKEG